MFACKASCYAFCTSKLLVMYACVTIVSELLLCHHHNLLCLMKPYAKIDNISAPALSSVAAGAVKYSFVLGRSSVSDLASSTYVVTQAVKGEAADVVRVFLQTPTGCCHVDITRAVLHSHMQVIHSGCILKAHNTGACLPPDKFASSVAYLLSRC